MRLFTGVLFVAAASAVFGQPGDDGTLSVNVVDEKGNEIRGASVTEATVGTGRPVFMGRNFPTVTERAFKQLFTPRDEYRSSFIAPTFCKSGGSFSIKVSAPGYESRIISEPTKSCDAQMNVVLKRSSEALPSFERLTVLSGKLLDQRGRPITQRFTIIREGKEYIPKIGKDGSYSARLLPGLYEIIFNEFNCTEFSMRNYRIGSEPRTLNFTPDCE